MSGAMTLTVEQVRSVFDAGYEHGYSRSCADERGYRLAKNYDEAFESAVADLEPLARASLSRTEVQGVAEGVDEIVTRLYRRFKDWSKRGFGPDDVTWCEVKADVVAMLAAAPPPPAPSTDAREGEVEQLRACLRHLASLASMCRHDMQGRLMDKVHHRAFDVLGAIEQVALSNIGDTDAYQAALASGGRGDE
jgi:hypothetical protein